MRLVTGRFLCNVILVRFCFVLLVFFLPLLLHSHLWFTFIEKIFPIQCSQLLFNSWVRASVPRVIAGTRICKRVTRSLAVDGFVINRVRIRECEDLSFPKKHALRSPRGQLRVFFVANFPRTVRRLTKFKTRGSLSSQYDGSLGDWISRAFDSSRR